MEPQSQSPARLAFGPFEVNVPAGQLLKSGVRIRLSGQPFQILLILLAHSGDVVTNEQLRAQIWTDGKFVDFEHGLHAAVNKLRRSLGDSAENPRYIETVPGRGYRFIGAVDRRRTAIPPEADMPDSSPSPAQADGEFFPARSKSRRWLIAAVLTLLLGALGLWVTSYLRQTPTDERVLSLQINPPEGSEFTFGTQAAGISLSPDGKTAAYVAADKGKAAVWPP
jgi:DNA-binding winged helix-turn-helix (wHTH) protein